MLWPDGRVIFEPGGPGFVLPNGALGMKWPWWSPTPGILSIEGQRLDGATPPLGAKVIEGVADNGGFYPTYLVFPTPGCWHVRGSVGQATLTFVTEVVRVGEGPNWRPDKVP